MDYENQRKHLEFLQCVINRMAGNSFLLKGWCVTLVSALLALAAKDSNLNFIIVIYYPVFMFWILDAYFLRQEKLFRKKYDEIRQNNAGTIDFSMNTSTVKNQVDPWWRVALSETLFLFYGTMIGAISLLIMFIGVRL